MLFLQLSQTPLLCAYATSPKAQSTQGQASPGTASNVAPTDPVSASADEQRVRKQKATGGAASQDSASVAQPVSDPSGSGMGRQEEDHPGATQTLKKDPWKESGENRRAMEEQGKKPLDAADR
ncbi:hypothetical protein F5Y06DRAFT_298533 [Hypoxylon sp. FL0890]|nr:hypothetical protein F5Y06DRAFT_298533 [Hypoxylon sp. FL0890]